MRLGRLWQRPFLQARRIVLANGIALAVATCSDSASAEAEGDRLRAPAARVVAVRPAELADDPTSFTTVLSTDDYRGEVKTTEDLLSQSVGVQLRRFGGPGQNSEISIRGSSSQQVVILLDGVRINTAQSGSVDLSTIPLSLIESIEVSRGGGAVQAGSDAIGGVVNLVTRSPGDRPRASVAISGGSFGTGELSLAYDQRLGDWGVALGYDGFETDGDWKFQTAEFRGTGGILLAPSQELVRINNRSESHAGLLQVQRWFGDSLKLSASDHLFFVSRGQPGFDSGSGLDGGQRAFAHERRLRNVFALELEHDALAEWGTAGLRAAGRIFHRTERLRFVDAGALPEIEVLDRNTSVGARAELGLEGSVAWSEHRASLAVELRRDSLDTESSGRLTPRRTVAGVFVQDEVSFWDDRILMAPALRYDHSGGLGGEWVPRIGLTFEPWPFLRIKSNVERAYRVPNLDELFLPNKGFVRGNPNLRPEDALSADAGIQVGLAQLGFLRDLSLEVVFFGRDVRNSIVFQALSPSVIVATNTGDARIRGIELSGGLSVLDWLDLSANWTRVKAEFESTGHPLPGRPKDEVSLRAALKHPSGVAGLSVERHSVSQIANNFGGQSFISGYAVWSARIFGDLAPFFARWSPPLPNELIVSLAALNFTDRSLRDSLNFPRPGRSFTLKLEGRW